jgi:hypothetical protein
MDPNRSRQPLQRSQLQAVEVPSSHIADVGHWNRISDVGKELDIVIRLVFYRAERAKSEMQ